MESCISILQIQKKHSTDQKGKIFGIHQKRGIEQKLIKGSKRSIYTNPYFCTVKHEKTTVFETTRCVRQDCILNQLLFSIVVHKAIKAPKKRNKAVQYRKLEEEGSMKLVKMFSLCLFQYIFHNISLLQVSTHITLYGYNCRRDIRCQGVNIYCQNVNVFFINVYSKLV